MSPSTHRPHRFRNVSYRWMRQIHLWIGAWGALATVVYGFTGLVLNHRFGDDAFFLIRIADTKKNSRVADAVLCGLVFFNKFFQDPHIAHTRMRAFADKIINLRLAILAVAIDPPVALLKAQQRPREIEMDQPVALIVEVEPLGRHVGGDQDPDR